MHSYLREFSFLHPRPWALYTPRLPPSLFVERREDVGQMSRCIHRRMTGLAFHFPFITITNLYLPLDYINTSAIPSIYHPRDCGVLLAAPRLGAVCRRRNVGVPCNDYFFDFAFITVIFLLGRVEIHRVVLVTPSLVAKLSPRVPRHLFFFLCY
ncbi:hypothetical protein B0H11DRAFT_2066945 [Mycena galericulata]|nr:hypothetical protein B0H11DRAFT_2066945 [Mycena galericulata]